MAQNDWALTFYGGKLSGDSLYQTWTFREHLEDSYFLDLGLSKRFALTGKYISWEVEGNLAKHFGQQHQFEVNALIAGRWLLFPWNKYIYTTFAVGEGLSLALGDPEFEEKHYQETSRFLNYMMYEFTFSLPHVPQWALVTRIHHRSGMFGVFNGVTGASNGVAIGIRYLF